jgi:uncharacterized protein YndB with AHSA1/START domain
MHSRPGRHRSVARNEIHIDARPEAVFSVLSDAEAYGDWVVGSRRVRDADPDFPAVGSRFHHQVGIPPLLLNDHTEVLESQNPSRLVLRAKTRPFATARVELRLVPDGSGTRVVMFEGAGDLPSRLVLNPLTDPLVHARNSRSLQRLRRLSEGVASSR